MQVTLVLQSLNTPTPFKYGGPGSTVSSNRKAARQFRIQYAEAACNSVLPA